MKKVYESPIVEIVNLSENDILFFSSTDNKGGSLDEKIIFFSDLLG